ncbi:MAG TPA: ACP S-malonyltransferase [bacterium]|nr:ACP S-malonyltransferase [bacterium]
MTKIVVFPGQGSQVVGMGKDLYENSSDARAIFDAADAALGFSITKICFEGPAEDLMLTKHTQPAILTVSYALWNELSKRHPIDGVKYMAGHSLGEYTALVASGAVDFAEAVRAVHQRGSFMQDAVEFGKGSMAAVIDVPRDTVYKICDESGHIVSPANFNSPKQIVISGIAEGVDWVVNKLKTENKKAMKLKVSAPFHSELMKPAETRMKEVLWGMNLNGFRTEVISNVTARPFTSIEEIRPLLTSQICGAVNWEDSILFAHRSGVTELIEVGPGNVLAKLAGQIVPDMKTRNVANWTDIQNFGA